MGRRFARLFDNVIDIFLSRKKQERLGWHILNRARGEGNDDMVSNGEFRLLEAIKMQLRGREAVIFDVGANLGEWSRQAASGMDGKLCIYAFEPCQPIFTRLEKSLPEEVAPVKFSAMNVAMSDAEGLMELYITGAATGTNSLYRRRAEAFGVFQSSTEAVPTLSGDAFCRQRGIGGIDLLKIDTEGHEMKVLLGFESMLKAGRIDWIQIEYGGTWIDARSFLVDMFDFFQPKGYRLGKILPGTIEFYEFYDQHLDNFNYANYVACRSDLAETALR